MKREVERDRPRDDDEDDDFHGWALWKGYPFPDEPIPACQKCLGKMIVRRVIAPEGPTLAVQCTRCRWFLAIPPSHQAAQRAVLERWLEYAWLDLGKEHAEMVLTELAKPSHASEATIEELVVAALAAGTIKGRFDKATRRVTFDGLASKVWSTLVPSDRDSVVSDSLKLDHLLTEIKLLRRLVKQSIDAGDYHRAGLLLEAQIRKLHAAVARAEGLGMGDLKAEHARDASKQESLLLDVQIRVTEADCNESAKILDALSKDANVNHLHVYVVRNRLLKAMRKRLSLLKEAGRNDDAIRISAAITNAQKEQKITALFMEYEAVERHYGKCVEMRQRGELEAALMNMRILIDTTTELEHKVTEAAEQDAPHVPALVEKTRRFLSTAVDLQISIKEQYTRHIEGEPSE